MKLSPSIYNVVLRQMSSLVTFSPLATLTVKPTVAIFSVIYLLGILHDTTLIWEKSGVLLLPAHTSNIY
jgi:hypothetical protein